MRITTSAVVTALIIGLCVAPSAVPAPARRLAVYASVGADLTTYLADVAGGALAKQATVRLPESVQEAWPHPSGRYLYVAWSSGGPGEGGHHHGVSAFRIDPSTGILRPHGEPIALAARTVHLTGDIPGTHLIVASSEPSGVTVHGIAADGTLGAQVPQSPGLDVGIYAHQVRIDPTNRMVVLMTRGNEPTPTKAEDLGALKVFGYADGTLTNRASIAPGGGHSFRVRHLDFHPSQPWAFVTLEAQNRLQVYRVLDGPTLGPEPLFSKETRLDPTPRAGQQVSSVHVHPNGRFVYVANRASGTTEFQGQRVFAGGENSIAVFTVDQKTGEPTLVQHADAHGFSPRTFAIDPSGRLLVVDNSSPMLVREKDAVRSVLQSLSVFRIGGDGRLTFVRKYDQEAKGTDRFFWTGMVPLP
jgi:6-phosphogluconolactonase (cycloisomerase 2 family)